MVMKKRADPLKGSTRRTAGTDFTDCQLKRPLQSNELRNIGEMGPSARAASYVARFSVLVNPFMLFLCIPQEISAP